MAEKTAEKAETTKAKAAKPAAAGAKSVKAKDAKAKSTKSGAKPAKAKAAKSKKKARDEPTGDMGIVIVEDDLSIDQDKINEERRAYLEEARSQEAFD